MFASDKNRLIKVIRTEKDSSPFEACLKDYSEKKKKSFRSNFQIILLTNKLICFYKTGQFSYLTPCYSQRCCTNMANAEKKKYE